MNVLFTVDVEIWCDGWNDLDARFPDAFRRYIYGPTAHGEVGLRHQIQVLRDHGMQAVFFVEPLFATRFGMEPLREIVGLVAEGQQELQLHLHPEWVDEVDPPLVSLAGGKRPLMRQYPRADQATLVAEGLRLLRRAGGSEVTAFRAGSFGFDLNTMAAVQSCKLTYDSSYNATLYGPDSGLAPGQLLTDACCDGPVTEVPMSVFDDGFGRLRHAQLGACSSRELEALLWQAAERGQQSFVILSHNFELLTPSRQRADRVVQRRFARLCRFLDRNRDSFRVGGFHALPPIQRRPQAPPLKSTRLRTGLRTLEQAWRRSYR